MDCASLKSYAKVNISLDVISKRTDGFHNIKSIFQTVSLHDIVQIKKINSGINIICRGADIPEDKNNTAYKAAEIFCRTCKIGTGVEISIQKNIPVMAGLGGGSSNAAAVLIGLGLIAGIKIKYEDLCKMGAQIGSDVPFFIRGGKAFVEGRGEILKALPPINRQYMVIVKPEINVSTAWAYKNLDLSKRSPDIANIFETVVFPVYPQVRQIKERLLSLGANFALMSGSGSAVFSIMKGEADADNVYNKVKNEYPFVCKSYTVDKGVELIK